MKVGLLSLGCKVNSCETEQMREDIISLGMEITDFESFADIYIVDTCSVTNIADRKSRQMLHKARKQNPDCLIIATGCYAQIKGEKLISDGDADVVIGNNHKSELKKILSGYISLYESGKQYNKCLVDDIAQEKCFEKMSIYDYPERTRAFVKIQDGCNQFCSYCIIPYARGRVRSRDEEEIVSEVMTLVNNGFKEVVLTGIHISSYGNMNYEQMLKKQDSSDDSFDGNALLHLIERLSEIDGLERIRLGSLEPRIITEDFAEKLSENRKFCPHFHLSLQSGCDSVLKRMNRHYSSEEFLDKCTLLNRVFDRPAITTDVIVGFPGETAEEFEEGRQMLEKVHFAKMHIFKYSRRAGTVADKMSGQLTENVKHERSIILQELDNKMHKEYLESFIGEDEQILIEERNVEGFRGLTGRYVPVLIPFENASDALNNINVNQLINVNITGMNEEMLLIGKLV